MTDEITRSTAADEAADAIASNEEKVTTVGALRDAINKAAAKEAAEAAGIEAAREVEETDETDETEEEEVVEEFDDEEFEDEADETADDEDEYDEEEDEEFSEESSLDYRDESADDDEDYEAYDNSIHITKRAVTTAARDDEDEEEGELPQEEDFEDALPEVYAKVRKNSILKGLLPETPVITFDHVTKEYDDGPDDDDSRALKEVSFKINKGEFVFIVGPSGSGKSTLIRLLMREIRPTEGAIYIAGTDLSKLRNNQVCKYRRSIGIVFQDFRLLEDRTVYENIAFAQKVIGVPSRKIARNVAKMLTLVGLRNKYKSYPNKLSGGEQQRVALARALINNPLILLADEPTGNLDPKNTEEIMDLLEEINMRGTTVVVVTHNREIVDAMQKRVIMLNEGVIVDDKKGGYSIG
ncbi:MAG: cell division ATP-binding protein FtsE [Lachnospiraceae bacterium]|nr:cell division ATP-binding protein FtsE [Lachnospiraceae bacterium]